MILVDRWNLAQQQDSTSNNVTTPNPSQPPRTFLTLQLVGVVVTGVVLSLWMISSYRNSPTHFRLSGATMGTQYSITYHYRDRGKDSDNVQISQIDRFKPSALKLRVENLLTEFNRYFSTYIEDSQISIFNRLSSSEPMVVHADFITMIQRAQHWYELSGGAYDPTVSPLIDLWGFGAGGSPRTSPPESTQVQNILKQTGFDKLVVDPVGSALQKTIPELQLNLSSIAKGYAVDKLSELLDQLGIEDYLVEIGGELRARGTNERDVLWSVGIETPTQNSLGSVIKTVQLEQMSIASSGSYRNAFRYQDKNYSHIINPSTGHPVEHQTVAVTVMAQQCVDADGLATALLVMGAQQGQQLATQHDMAAMFVEISADSSPEQPAFHITTTAAWDQLMVAEPSE